MENTTSQKGFTLIELVMVIVILGILAAVAIPRFIDLSGNAQQATIDGLAGAYGTAASNNYAACSAVSNVPTAGKCVTIAKCSDVSGIVQGGVTLRAAGAATTGTYNLAADTAVATNGTQGTCTLQIITNGATYTANFTVIGAGE